MAENGLMTTEEFLGKPPSTVEKERLMTTEEFLGKKPPSEPSPFAQFAKGTLGLAETGVKIMGDMDKFLPTGILGGIMAFLPEGTTKNDFEKVLDYIQKGLTYKPRTEEGKMLSSAIDWAFGRFEDWGEQSANYIRENLQPHVGEEAAVLTATTVGSAIKFLPYVVGLKGVFRAKAGMRTFVDAKAFEETHPPVEGMTLEPDIAVAGAEPSINLEQLKSTPSLADYVTKRPQIHLDEVVKAAEEIKRTEGVAPKVHPVSEEAVTPTENLRPAIIYEDRTLIGNEGETHPDIIKREGIEPEASHERGFATPEGEFLNRSQAEEWMRTNQPGAYEKWAATVSETTLLHSEDYIKAISKPEPTGIPPKPEAKAKRFTIREQPTLQAAIVPGLKEFVEQDIIPKAQQLGRGLASTWREFKNLVAPRAGVPREEIDLIMKMKGTQEKAEYLLERTSRNIEKDLDKMSQQEQINWFDRAKTGKPQASRQLDQVRDMVTALDDGLYNEMIKFKPGLNYLENHFRLLYKTIPRTLEEGFRGIFRRPLEGTKGFLKRHFYETLSDAIAQGGVPITYNPMRMFRYHYADAMKFITVNKMWDGLRDIGARKFVRFGKNVPEGFVRLKDRMAKIYVPTSEWGGTYVIAETFKESVSETTKTVKETITEVGRTEQKTAVGKVEEKALEALRARGWSEGESQQILDRVKNAPAGEAKDKIIEREVERTVNRLAEIKSTREFVPGKGFVYAGEWYIEEGAARLLNGFLSRDLIRESALGRGLMWVKNSTTAVELGFFNTFHGTFEALESVASGVGHGIRTVWNEGILGKNAAKIEEGMKEIGAAPYAPIGKARIGGSFVKYITNKDEFLRTTRGQNFIKQFPDPDALIDDLFTAGAKLAMHEDYRIGSIQTFRENLSANNYIGAGLRAIPAFNEMVMNPLFNVYIPRTKNGVWAKEFTSELARRRGDVESGKITRAELSRDIWDSVENRFGEMNFDNLFWDRTFKTALQAVIRSVTWKLGNIKMYGKAVTGTVEEMTKAFKERRLPELTPEMGWVLGVATTHVALASIIQTVFTGKPPSEITDFFYPKIDKEGNRISPPTYMRDLFSLVKAPLKYVAVSSAGYIGRFIECLNNKNFYGVEIHDPESSFIQERVDDMIHMIPTPFGISNMIRLQEAGTPIQRSIIANFGFGKAPYWIEQSKAEQLAGELLHNHMEIGPRTKEQFARAELRKQYAQEIQKVLRDNPQKLDEVIKKMAGDMENKKLILDDVNKIALRLKEPIEGKVSRLSLREAFKVWDISSEHEKKKLMPIIAGKIGRTRDVEELEKLRPKIGQFEQEIEGAGQ